MDLMKEDGSTSLYPLLDGMNYGYWKVKTRAFIKSIDENAWRSVLQGWKLPTKTDAKGKTCKTQEKFNFSEKG